MNSTDDSTLSKSMTIMAGSSQLQSHRVKNKRDSDCRSSRSKSRSELMHHHDTESESSDSPINDFSNMSTYRVPTKSRGKLYETQRRLAFWQKRFTWTFSLFSFFYFLLCKLESMQSLTGGMFRPDSSTESNNDHSPIERRSNTPRHIVADMRIRTRHVKTPRESQSMDILRSGSNNR